MANDLVLQASFNKLTIQNYLDHHLVIRLNQNVLNKLRNPDNFCFVGINNILLKWDNPGHEFLHEDCLEVFYYFRSTGEKQLLLRVNLYPSNNHRMLHLYSLTKTNYCSIESGDQNVIIKLQTNIGRQRIFDSFKVEIETVIRQV